MKKLLLALLASMALSFSAFAAVNINTATQAELESLDGIGPVKAAAIIDYRKKNGGFKSVDELEKVDGVGPVTLANVKKDVAVSGSTSVPAAAAKPAAKDAKDMKKDAPVKEMAKKDITTPAATVKVDDKATDKKAAKADKAMAKDTKAEKPAAAADTSKADAKAAKDAAKADKKAAAEKAKVDKKAAADKAKADKKAAADAKKADKADKAKTEKK